MKLSIKQMSSVTFNKATPHRQTTTILTINECISFCKMSHLYVYLHIYYMNEKIQSNTSFWN